MIERNREMQGASSQGANQWKRFLGKILQIPGRMPETNLRPLIIVPARKGSTVLRARARQE
ncbi:MAG TPA: hypothetical protein VHL08_06375 [Dongiaceae bacterium]|nr:hypothetical protein [Dongiaceae bacterium]